VARNKKKCWRRISTKHIGDQLEDIRVQKMPDVIFNSKSEPNGEHRL
jgi:hypothetical protein